MIDETRSRNIKLRFVTAREAYNIVKAAEAGLSGDPEKYHDYIIALLVPHQIRRYLPQNKKDKKCPDPTFAT